MLRASLLLLPILIALTGADPTAPNSTHNPQADACDVTVRRLAPTSLLAHWRGPPGARCDVHLYTTNGGRAAFCAAFSWVASPVLLEHISAAGARQDLRLCVGCCGRRRAKAGPGDARSFCCADFAPDELKGDGGWRLNRKPVESTLVACFMTLVIIVWSVAALIWPVPIIAGFLPNGMEQRRQR